MRVNRAIDERPAHTAGGHLLSVIQASYSKWLNFGVDPSPDVDVGSVFKRLTLR